MKNIEGKIVKAKDKSGTCFSVNMNDFAREIIEHITSYLIQITTDIEYKPETVTPSYLRRILDDLNHTCRTIASLLQKATEKRCYCHIVMANDLPLEGELDEENYIQFPAGVKFIIDGEESTFACDVEALFSNARMSKYPTWYKEWARKYILEF